MDKSYIFEAERNTLETQIKMTIDASENHGLGFKGTTGIGFSTICSTALRFTVDKNRR